MPPPSSPLRVVASCVLIATAAPGCSFFKSRGPSSNYRPDYAPQCTTSKTPPITDAVVGGLVAIGTVSAATQAAGAFSSSTQNQKDAQSALPGLILVTGGFAAASVFGFIQSNRCDEAMATWGAAVTKRKKEAQARAEAVRQEAQRKAEAAAEEARRIEQERLAAEEARRQEEKTKQDRQSLASEGTTRMQAAGGEQTASDEAPAGFATVTPKNASEPRTPVPPGYRSTEGHQKARWGMTRAEIKQLYPNTEALDDGKLAFLGETAGNKTATIFSFVGDKLASVTVALTENRMSAAQYISDYNELRELLTKKYGAPKKDEVKWHDRSMFDTSLDHLGTAVTIGHASMFALWETPDTYIGISATSGKLRINVAILYMSRTLRGNLEEAQEKAKTDDL